MTLGNKTKQSIVKYIYLKIKTKLTLPITDDVPHSLAPRSLSCKNKQIILNLNRFYTKIFFANTSYKCILNYNLSCILIQLII